MIYVMIYYARLTVTIAGTGLAAFAGQGDGIIAFGWRAFVLDIATLNACNDATLFGYLERAEHTHTHTHISMYKYKDYRLKIET